MSSSSVISPTLASFFAVFWYCFLASPCRNLGQGGITARGFGSEGFARAVVFLPFLGDAAGETLDKLAKFLGLGYPGGPLIDRLSKEGDPHRFPFSIPKISDGSPDFSFSGFKTAALRHIQQAGIKPRRPGRKASKIILDLVASYQ